MNRLWVRLGLAFSAVIVAGIGTLTVLVDWQAASQFRQYLGRQQALSQSGLLADLAQAYARNGDWSSAEETVSAWVGSGGRGQGRGGPPLVLADAAGIIVFQQRGQQMGAALTADEIAAASPVVVDGETVGYVVLGGPGSEAATLEPAEQGFLDQLRTSLFIAALAATAVGLVLGGMLSWTLSTPLARLADAARALADRQWDRRVPLNPASPQEVAEVTRAFNTMADSLQQAENARRTLMADVAHELRTPLTVVQGNLRALLDGVYPLELTEIATLYDETRLLNRLVDDLRELSLAEAGQLSLAVQDVSVGPWLATAIAGFAPVADAQQVTLSAAPVDPTWRVRADPDRMSQVVRNLLANAIRHTPAGGRVTVSIEFAAPLFWIEVADDGEGIDPEALAHVFDRFYRADPSRARSSGGSGLGLAIARAWVQAMGGTITAASRPGQGSRFRFSLPATRRL